MRPYFAHRTIEDLGDILRSKGLIDAMVAVEAPTFFNRVPTIRWIITPIYFLMRIIRIAGRRPIIVRDFNNLQILLTWPILWFFRKRLFWINNHNLQSAIRKPFIGRFMQLALASGFNLLLIESHRGKERLAMHPTKLVVLPYPIRSGRVPAVRKAGLRVGFVGRFRADKAQEEALEYLLANAAPGMEIVVANPDEAVRRRYASRNCTVLDTSTDEQYRTALAQIDVAVINYRREAYEFRPSGVVRDLLEAGVAVVCPDFPVLADQIATPQPVGRTYSRLSDLPAVLEELRRDDRLPAGFASYFTHRSPDAIADSFARQYRELSA